MALHWFADDITEIELEAIKDLGDIAYGHESVASRVVGMPWFEDGITEMEAAAIDDLGRIAFDNGAAADRVVDLAWFEDGITEMEAAAIDDLGRIAFDNGAAADRVVDLAWFTDGLTMTEANVIQKLRLISQKSGAASERIIKMPFLVTIEPTDLSAMTSLSRMAYFRLEAFDGLMSHRSLTDGITDNLTPVVAMLYGVVKTNPGLLETLLDPEGVSIERRSIVTPLSGNVELVIVRTRPGAARGMDILEHSVRAVEELMGEPLPTQYIGLLYEDAVIGAFAGTNFGTHIAILPKYDVDDDSHEADFAPLNIAHEVAHYYWSGNDDWVDEGVAEFIASEIENKRTGKPVTITNDPCPYARSIAELEALRADSDTDGFGCNYSLGERLFVDMYRSMDRAAFWQGLHELYIRSQVENADDDEREGTLVSIEHIREAFHQAAAAATVMARWYDGTEPYDLSKLDTEPVAPVLPTINGLIDKAFISIGKDGPQVSSFSAQHADDRVWLTLKYSYDVKGGPYNLPLRVVEFYEDGFEYDRRSIELTASEQYIGGTQRITVGPGQDEPWAPGQYWVYVYEGGRKVAEVQYEVTP